MGKTKSGKDKISNWEKSGRSFKSKDKWKKYSKSSNVFDMEDDDEYDNWIPDVKPYR